MDGITDTMDMSLSKLQGVDDGQGGLACCSPWGRKESNTTEWLDWTEAMQAKAEETQKAANKETQHWSTTKYSKLEKFEINEVND